MWHSHTFSQPLTADMGQAHQLKKNSLPVYRFSSSAACGYGRVSGYIFSFCVKMTENGKNILFDASNEAQPHSFANFGSSSALFLQRIW